jgi:uncharacterized repeat protein (TIGR02543 family)
LPVPTKTGYTFIEWCLDEELKQPVSLPLTLMADVTLYPKWEINTYRISLITDGEIWESLYVNYEETLNELPVPTKTSYTFLGWYFFENLTMPMNTPFVVSSDLTCYSKWQINDSSGIQIFKNMVAMNVVVIRLQIGMLLSVWR